MSDDFEDIRADVEKAIVALNAFYNELKGESNRAAAILAVASLEDELERLLRSKFPRTITPKTWKDIAGPGQTPFGSYKARICVAYAFDFFGLKTRRTLETIATVRNKFAHRTDVREFTHPQIIEHYKKLTNNPFAPFRYREGDSNETIRNNFLEMVEAAENSLEKIRLYVPGLGDQPPAPLP